MLNAAATLAELRLRELLRVMVRLRASDLHVASGMPPVARVDGRIAPVAMSPLREQEVEELAATLAIHGASAHRDTAGHLDFAIEDAEFESYASISTAPAANGLRC